MSAAELLDLPEIRAQYSPTTVEQYRQFPEFNERGKRTELIEGLVLEKVAKSPLHASIAKLIYDQFYKAAPRGFSVRQDQPLTLRSSEPEPDIAIVRGSDEDFFDHHPETAELVIEIAVTSLALDREKARIYAAAGVSEYWILTTRERRVERYSSLAGGKYTDVTVSMPDAFVKCSSVPGIELNLDQFHPLSRS